MEKNKKYNIIIIFLTISMLGLLNACLDPDYNIRTNYQILIGEYLEENSDEFSTFYDVLEKSNSISFLKAYGTYTCFAPTNEAFEKYLQEKGKASIDEFTDAELRDLVRYHIIIDTIPSTDFVDGRLQTANMYGQYLTTRTFLEGGDAVFKVNKYAAIKSADNRMLNGIVHTMESVLDPITPTIADLLEADPEYSIFTEALKATTWFDTLELRLTEDDFNFNYEEGDEVTVTRWFTVMAVPNSAYADSSIQSLDDLKAKYSQTGDPSNPTDSLFLHMAYHILDSTLMYVSDFASITTTAGYFTKAPLEVITVKVDGSNVLVNEDEYLGNIEKGAAINRDASDNTANNGVFHSMSGDFFIKVRFPTAVYWDVTDQFEIKKIPGVYRKQGVSLEYGQLADILWYPENYTIYYSYSPGLDYGGNVLDDRLHAYIRPEVIKWIQFRSPIVVKGTYKIWICTRNVYPFSGKRKPIFFVYVDEEKLPIIIDNSNTLKNDDSDAEWELRGFKHYSYNPSDSLEQQYTSIQRKERYVGQLAGTIEFKTTGRHWIKFVAISAYAGNELWLDQIHIIPAENDQVWPKPRTDNGALQYKEDLPPQ